MYTVYTAFWARKKKNIYTRIFLWTFMSNESPIVSFRVPLSAVKELIAKGRLTEEYTKSELSNLVKEDWLKSQSIDFNVPVPNSVLEKVLAKLNNIEEEG